MIASLLSFLFKAFLVIVGSIYITVFTVMGLLMIL